MRSITTTALPRSALTLCAALAFATLGTACISIERSASSDSADIARMSEEALKVCGAGLVKEVTAKNFTCK
jgi:hypothetical protein